MTHSVQSKCLLIICMLLNQVAVADDDDLPEPISAKQNQTTVYIKGSAQAQAGLETIELKPASFQSEFSAMGKAVNLQPLLLLRSRYLLSLTEHRGIHAKLKHAGQNARRMQNLYQQGITAERHLQAQQAQLQAEQAQLDASNIQTQTIVDEALLGWGRTLTDWALSNDAKALSGFLSGKQALLLITIPVGRLLPAQPHNIYVDSAGDRNSAQTATFISAAPQQDNTTQGDFYFFQTSGARIKPGMRLTAWLPEQQQQSGVIIPKSALLWHMNQTFVYLKTDINTFVRQPLTDYSDTSGGYFVSTGLLPGQLIVTRGAQLLLSEEIRGQISSDD